MPIRVVGGLKKQDLKPVALITQTPQLSQILTTPQYTPTASVTKIQQKEMGKDYKNMIAKMLVYVYP